MINSKKIPRYKFKRYSRYFKNDKKEFNNFSQVILMIIYLTLSCLFSEKINLNRKEIKVYSLNSPLGSNINLFSDSIKMLKNLIQIKKYYRVQS